MKKSAKKSVKRYQPTDLTFMINTDFNLDVSTKNKVRLVKYDTNTMSNKVVAFSDWVKPEDLASMLGI